MRHVLIAFGAGTAFILIVAFLQPFASIEWRLGDLLFRPTSPSPNIVIAAIDDYSLEQYGKWSDWPRSLHARAIANLNQAKAMVIGYDVIFASDTANDPQLARAMEDAGNVVLAAIGDQQIASANHQMTFQEIIYPNDLLENASVDVGHANVRIGSGGVVREIPLVVSDAAGESLPAFTLAVLHTHLSAAMPTEFEAADGKMHLLDRNIPVDDTRSMIINYVGGPSTFPQLSYADIIQGNFDPETVKFKIVLVGMTAAGEPDSWVTPASAQKMYGVEIHANAMDTILRQRFLTEASWGMTLFIVFLMVEILGLTLPFINLRWGTLLSVLLCIAYLFAVSFALDSGYILNIRYPLLAILIVYITVVLCRVTSAQADRREISSLFGRYVSPQVAGEILHLANTDRLELGGVRREVTVLFADIRGFTSMSERMEPEDIVATLNRYLCVVIERILNNGGMINKFAGDSIMAVWNAPQDQSDYALLAVKAALESQQAIADMPQESDQTQVQFGMGINTGLVLAGNIGAEGRAEYTIIGDAVNLASRLCSNAPGGQIWIGAQTYEQVREEVDVEELEPQHFKGKAKAVSAYRVLGLRKGGIADE
jgi:adenylate cyclase